MVNNTSLLLRITHIWDKLWNSRDCDRYYHFHICYNWTCWDSLRQYGISEGFIAIMSQKRKQNISAHLYCHGKKQKAICAFSSRLVWQVRTHTSLLLWLMMRTFADVNFTEWSCPSLGMCGITAAQLMGLLTASCQSAPLGILETHKSNLVALQLYYKLKRGTSYKLHCIKKKKKV